MQGGLIRDHTIRLGELSPALFESLEREQERTAVTFGALWRPMLALEAWAGRVDTQMVDMSQAGYNDHRLVHDMLVQQAALQRELQEMRDRVTALEQKRDPPSIVPSPLLSPMIPLTVPSLVATPATAETDRYLYQALRQKELALEEDDVYSTFKVGQGSGSTPEPGRPEGVSAFTQPTFTTWMDP
nr:hypothetical protein [Tanacetum cinerariifolium]